MKYNPFIRLTVDAELKPFDCGLKDINDFFLNDAKKYQSRLLAVTYSVVDSDRTIVFFTLSNDKITASEERRGEPIFSKSFFRKIKSKFSHEKHRDEYPAVKIGRLGVHRDFRKNGQHWGSFTLDFIKDWMISKNKTGCCFITVDAYATAVEFYMKNGFLFLGNKEQRRYETWAKEQENHCQEECEDKRLPTFAMYFNLLTMLPDNDNNV